MKTKETTFPHFIRLTGVVGSEFWVNANLIEQVSSPTSVPEVFKNAKSVVWMSGSGDDEGMYVLETPKEIFERIYDDPHFTCREKS